MKITISGSLGHIGSPLAKVLLQKGHTVTVISSKPGKQKDIETLGATAAIGAMEDTDFIATAFRGADAVYTMVPPPDFMDRQLDLMAHYRGIGKSYAKAIEKSGIKRVVNLSSIGAHLDKDSGVILCHHAVEAILNKLTNVAITHIRPTSIYYNLFGFSAGIKSTGNIASNYGGEDKVSWVSPVDIATAVAEELETQLVGKKVRYAASDELTCNEVAGILGAAIDKPDLKWTVITDGQVRSSLEAHGMSPAIASGFAEMNASIHNGKFFEDYYLHRPAMGKVKMVDFAKEFSAAFNKELITA